MDLLKGAAGAGVVGVVLAIFGKLKVIFSKLEGVFFSRALLGPKLADVLARELRDNYRGLTLSPLVLELRDRYVTSENKSRAVLYRGVSKEPVMYYSSLSSPRLLFVKAEGDEHALRAVSVSIPRIFGDAAVFSDYLEKRRNTARWDQGRFYIRSYTGRRGVSEGGLAKATVPELFILGQVPANHDPDDLDGTAASPRLPDMALSEELETASREFAVWTKSREWYADKGLAYKHGWLLTGMPGTGKTAFVRALCAEHDLPLMVMDLATMTNIDYKESWMEIKSSTPCVVLLEDLDAVFSGRKNVSGGGMSEPLSFDVLLNQIDGAEVSSGLFLIITTNKPNNLDAALLRPGRIDRVISTGPPDRAGREKIARRILGNAPVRLVEEADGKTGAEFTEICSRRALDEFWSK